MRISDWSSDVCSSDLHRAVARDRRRGPQAVKMQGSEPMSWTDERIDRLKEYWSKGMTASQIADALGGVSRNAAIGTAHRLGLPSRQSPLKPNEPPHPQAKGKAQPTPAAPAQAPPPHAPPQ